METNRVPNEGEIVKSQQEQLRAELPFYPILDKSEVWDGVSDLRYQLSPSEQAELKPDEVVIHIHHRPNLLPERPWSPVEILMKASNANQPSEIGHRGPVLASVPLNPAETASRYQAEFGRDSLITAAAVYPVYPQLLDTTLLSLARSQGMDSEAYVPGQPYGFEKPGAIILRQFDPHDPVAQKFHQLKGCKERYYASADAPGLYIDALAEMAAANQAYLYDRTYLAVDGDTHFLADAFNLSLDWVTASMGHEGLIEYSNPYTDGRGMRNQGWKDSADSMVHPDGSWVNSLGGVAPIEIQCQTVISLRKAAAVIRSLYADETRALDLEARANSLRSFILSNGWVDDGRGGHFVMGWDRDDEGRLRQIKTRSINMHNVLRLLDMNDYDQRQMAIQTIRVLTSEAMLTRWGIRTMAADETAYGHRRYHCGPWPHEVNNAAASLAAVKFYGIDRLVGAGPTRLLHRLGCLPEHLSGLDGEEPELPDKDVYVYNRRYNEVYLVQQAPPTGQVWGPATEIGKQYRYANSPDMALNEDDRRIETAIIDEYRERYRAN